MELNFRKAILTRTGIVLDVIGEAGKRILNNGDLSQEYVVKKETASPQYTFRVCEKEIIWIN